MGSAFDKRYTMYENPPPPVSYDEYERNAINQYENMLDDESLSEKEYQSFFERNPAFIPGAFEAIGTSGHDPYLCSLISQPVIGSSLKRIPDFMWLAGNSLSFCPVFIEIEKPTKDQFRKDNIPNAKFTQALDQITEWKAILSKNENIQKLYNDFSIPKVIQEKDFTPQYVLIYGRREEFSSDSFLRSKRNSMQNSDTKIMSFDRLRPDRNVFNMVTVKVRNGKYEVISIPPTFVYQPCRAICLSKLTCFTERIDYIENISPERKAFLKKRFPYWLKYAELDDQGLINTSDKE